MTRYSIAVCSAFAALCAAAAPFNQKIAAPCAGEVEIACNTPGRWAFAAQAKEIAPGVGELAIRLSAGEPLPPPNFTVSFATDQLGIYRRWTSAAGKTGMPPDWACGIDSRLCGGMPLVALIDDADRNRMTLTVSEAKRLLKIKSGLREEDAKVVWEIEFFSEPEASIDSYEVRLRFDARDVFFGEAISGGIEWIGLKAAKVPASAFEPLYSTWYSFHQNLTDRDIEEECALAAKLGMKTLILDDGWQTDDTQRGYAWCGDWEVSKRRFPDMAAHVAKIHALGMKYVLWYAPPFIGIHSRNYGRFKGKYLHFERGDKAAVLDPRFPEVREFLCGVFTKAVTDWDIDGFKIDFVYRFKFKGADPAVAENYAGRDIKSLPEAVDVLMKEIHAAVTALKPDALIEFRQPYAGPGMLQYGNMFRASDCPGDIEQNRCRIANLRLTSGDAAVHSDMLMWNAKDTPQNAARFVLASLFGVVQYSVMLRTLPEDHRKMLAHWIDFSLRHRDALLHGKFRPHAFGHNYPSIVAENAAERIVAVYDGASVARCGEADRDVYVINATQDESVFAEFGGDGEAEIFDTFGAKVGSAPVKGGVWRLAVPQGGYAAVKFHPGRPAALAP